MEEKKLTLLMTKIEQAQQMLIRSTLLDSVPGIIKLRKKIKAEIKFLSKLQKEGGRNLKQEHLDCSNLVQLEALLDTAIKNLPNVNSILKPFHYSAADDKRMLIDIVADTGTIWLKVIARNPTAMYQISLGQGQFGEKSIVDHAKHYVNCATENEVFFIPPKIVFVFTNGVYMSLVKELEAMNINVEGKQISDITKPIKFHQSSVDSDNNSVAVARSDQEMECTSLNLDVSTMLAYVSNLTNGSCLFRFKEKVLDQQANCERLRPLKPVLDDMFKGKKLTCCKTAMDDFVNIIGTLGGKNERIRAKRFMQKITVLPDKTSGRTQKLLLSSQIKERSKIIFGSGDYYRSVTVTANNGFVRSAESQGVNLAVAIHESRSLTEAKEAQADKIDMSKWI